MYNNNVVQFCWNFLQWKWAKIWSLWHQKQTIRATMYFPEGFEDIPFQKLFQPIFFKTLFACVRKLTEQTFSWLYCSLPSDQFHRFPIWLLLFLQDYFVPFLGFAAISIKIVVKSGYVISRELFGINAFQSLQPSPVQIASAIAFPLQNPATPPATPNTIPSNEVAIQKDRSLKSVLKNTPSPSFPSLSFPPPPQNTPEMAHYQAATHSKKITSSQNSPSSPTSPVQNPATLRSLATSIALVSIEMAKQKDESLESVLQKTPSSTSFSTSLPPSPQNTPEMANYQAATHSKK